MASDNYPYDGGDDDDDDLAVCQRRLELLRQQVRLLTKRMQALEQAATRDRVQKEVAEVAVLAGRGPGRRPGPPDGEQRRILKEGMI